MKRINLKTLISILVLFTLSLSSCTAASPVSQEAIPAPPQAQPTINRIETGQEYSLYLDLKAISTGVSFQLIPAVPATADAPSWAMMPAYSTFTLSGYPIQNHLMQPQLFIFPAGELGKFNEAAGQIANNLKILLQNKQPGKSLPFLPLFNAAQVMHAQVKFIDFMNGKGVRFITQFDQAPLPINNHELFYTFQGITNDGKYYLAAILPVTQANLPANEKVNETDMDAYMKNFATSLANTVNSLNQLSSSNFNPDLAKLDALIQSIEIK